MYHKPIRANKLSLKTKLLSLLAKREYSRAEIQTKVLAWLARQKDPQATDDIESNALDEAKELNTILDEFEAKGWLSDARYVESLVNRKAPRLGAVRLKQELKRKGIEDGMMQEALEKLESSEYERAYEVWAKKFKVLAADPKSYQKQMRFLTYRGFSISVAKKILSNFKDD